MILGIVNSPNDTQPFVRGESFDRKSLKFDGSATKVNLGDVLNTGTSDFTIATWIKLPSALGSDNFGIFTKRVDGDNLWGLYVDGEGSLWFGGCASRSFKIQLSTNTGTIGGNYSGASDDEWHHIVLSVDRTTTANINFWVDGVALNTGTDYATRTLPGGADNWDNDDDLMIGTDRNEAYGDGMVSELAMWIGSPLDSTAITQIYNNGVPMDLRKPIGNPSALSGYNSTAVGNLSAYYRFGDSTSTTGSLVDASGNGNTGVITIGAGAYLGDTPERVYRSHPKNVKSTDFDGVNDYVRIPNSDDFDIDEKMTLSLFAKNGNSTLGATEQLVNKWGVASDQRSWRLILNDDEKLVFSVSEDGTSGTMTYTSDSAIPNIDNWNHYVIYVDMTEALSSRKVKFYLNGTEIDNTSSGESGYDVFFIGTHDIMVGCNGATNLDFWEGNIKDLVIMSGELIDIEDLVVDGKPTNYLGLPGLVSWNRLGDGELDTFNLMGDQNDPNFGSEMIGDGGFESGTDSWNNDGGATTISQSTDYKKSGTYSLKVVQSGGSYNRAYKTITTVSGKVYKFSFNTYKPSSGQDVAYIMRVATGTGETTPVSETISTLDAWVNTTGYFTATATTYYIVAFPHNSDSGNDTIYIDDLSVKLVNGNPGILINSTEASIVTDSP